MNQEIPLQIREISPEDTYPVRQLVLRPGRDPEECVFEGDSDPDTLHVGVWSGEQLAGVASYMKNRHPEFDPDVQYQLRGMAVLPQYQGKQVGVRLLLEGEKELLRRHRQVLLWFNARETAVGFYSKYGYQEYGESFMIPNVCRHIVMFKELK